MSQLGDRSYATCPSDGSCGCYDDELTSEDFPEPLDIEDAYVLPTRQRRLEQFEGTDQYAEA